MEKLSKTWQAGCVDSVTVGATGRTGPLAIRLCRLTEAKQARQVRPVFVTGTATLLLLTVGLFTTNVSAQKPVPQVAPKPTPDPLAQTRRAEEEAARQAVEAAKLSELVQRAERERSPAQKQAYQAAKEQSRVALQQREQAERLLYKTGNQRNALRKKANKTARDNASLRQKESEVARLRAQFAKAQQKVDGAWEARTALTAFPELERAAQAKMAAQSEVSDAQTRIAAHEYYLQYLQRAKRADANAVRYQDELVQQLRRAKATRRESERRYEQAKASVRQRYRPQNQPNRQMPAQNQGR